MIGFVRGIVHAYGSDFVLVDVNGIGYRIFFNRPGELTKGKEMTFYTYQNVREDELSLYGFLSLAEYDLFVKLLSVKGLGPKTAAGILSFGSVDRIISAIENGEVDYIRSLPGIGKKTASQVLLDLKGKLVQSDASEESAVDSQKLQDAIDALKALGYRAGEITPVINKLKKEDLSTDEYIRRALGMFSKRS